MELEDLEDVGLWQGGEVLWRDEDELLVGLGFGHFDEFLHGDLAGDLVHEDVELVHDAEGGVDDAADGHEQRQRRKGALAAAEGIDVVELRRVVVVVFLERHVQSLGGVFLRCLVLERQSAGGALAAEDVVELAVRFYGNRLLELDEALPPFPTVLDESLALGFDLRALVGLFVQGFPRVSLARFHGVQVRLRQILAGGRARVS
mmetsp:Transcript_23739/g.73077  ORF Transcript_23739/g.73077 Transcript_23739/m.73077 type:complete len:204 (-) Transcript_23739:679-1290(-)